jgi:hypothetical protein
VEFTNWAIGEPNNGGIVGILGKGEDCLALVSNAWVKDYPWNDLTCSWRSASGKPLKAICQKSIK